MGRATLVSAGLDTPQQLGGLAQSQGFTLSEQHGHETTLERRATHLAVSLTHLINKCVNGLHDEHSRAVL